jgi:general secretion pathway protein H
MTQARGFTLLEVMLVLMLLGGVAMTIIATLPTHSNLQQADERLTAALHWVTEQTTLENRIYGMTVTQSGWQLWVLSSQRDNSRGESLYWPQRYWHTVKVRQYQQPEVLPSDLILHLSITDETQTLSPIPDKADFLAPQLLFLPGGESPLFLLTLQEVDGMKQSISHSQQELQSFPPTAAKVF